MAERLVLCSFVVAGLAVVVNSVQPPVAAFWSRPPIAQLPQPPAAKQANNLPQAVLILPAGTALVEEDLLENGVIRTVLVTRDAKSLRDRYVWYHQRIAEELTVEQLAEKCNALKKESIGHSPEGEIEQVQKQLDQLKQKHQGDKGIATRIQGAIEALKKQPSAEFKSP